MPTLNFIICTYNRSKMLSECLLMLFAQINNSPYKEFLSIVIVDNNSTDDTEKIVKELSLNRPTLLYIKEMIQGLSVARNCGAKASKSDYICYIDDDARPIEGFVNSLYEVLELYKPDIAGGPIYPFYTSPKPSWFKDSIEVRRHSYETGFIDCPISGGNFTIRKTIVDEFGGFNISLGMVGKTLRLGEERDLIERYRSSRGVNGIKIYYSQNCAVEHHVPKDKMTIKYFLKRAFMSGRMRISIEQNILESCLLPRALQQKKSLKKMILGDGNLNILLRILYFTAMGFGILYEKTLNNFLIRKLRSGFIVK